MAGLVIDGTGRGGTGRAARSSEAHIHIPVVWNELVPRVVEQVECLAADLKTALFAERNGLEDADGVVDVGRSVNVRQPIRSVLKIRRRCEAGGIEILVLGESLSRIAG